MKKLLAILLLLSAGRAFSQHYTIGANTGNHHNIIAACYDSKLNQLICLDQQGFIVIWDMKNYSIVHKFQLPPETAFGPHQKEISAVYQLSASDSTIMVHNPGTVSAGYFEERIVEIYHRSTGNFLQQSAVNEWSTYAYDNKNNLLACRSKMQLNGYQSVFKDGTIEKISPDGKNTLLPLTAAVSSVAVDNENKRLALGYVNGHVEIRNLQNLQLQKTFNDFENSPEKRITQVAFIPHSENIVYTAQRSGAFIIRNANNGEWKDSMMATAGRDYRFSVSPSGKKISAVQTGFYHLFTRNLLEKKTEKISISGYSGRSLSYFLQEVFFINDAMLIGCGSGPVYNNANGFDAFHNGAYIGLLECASGIAGSNLNIPTSSVFGNSNEARPAAGNQLQTTILTRFNDNYIYTDPVNLALSSGSLQYLGDSVSSYFVHKKQQGIPMGLATKNGSNTAHDFTKPGIAGTLLYNRRQYESDSFYIAFHSLENKKILGITPVILPNKAVPFYDLLGVDSEKFFSFFKYTFKNTANRRQSNLVIFNAAGKKVFEDTLQVNPNGASVTMAPGAAFFAYQNKPGLLLVRSLEDFTIQHQTGTGFQTVYGENTNGHSAPQFLLSGNGELLYETMGQQNGNSRFCLVKTNISEKNTDTLFSSAVRPVHYSADSSGKQLSMLFNYDLSDSVFQTASLLGKALSENLKSIFKPTAYIYDVQGKDFTTIINTGNIASHYIYKRGDWLNIFQNDGRLLYIHTKNKQKRIRHFIYNEDQALMTDSFYFASPALLPTIKIERGSQYISLANADILLNRPHAVLNQLGSPASLTSVYKTVYEKRRKQKLSAHQTIAEILEDNIVGSNIRPAQTSIVTGKSKLWLPVTAPADRAAIARVKLAINGQPVSGRNGIPNTAINAEGEIEVEFNEMENLVSLTPYLADGKQLSEIRYNYIFRPEKQTAGRLLFFSAGVSKYKDSAYNLKYAAKDALDIFEAFRDKSFDTILHYTLLDEEVTKENLQKWSRQMEAASVNDVVIVFLAGHGLLSEDVFYFATHNIDFKKPALNGITYDDLLALLDKSLSRKKILLLDACHSGLYDHTINNSANPDGQALVINTPAAKRSAEPLHLNKPTLSQQQAFVFMNTVFNNLENDLGVDIFTASLGNSYALELEKLKNGLFTYQLIKAIALNQANKKFKEGQIYHVEWKEVKEYVEREVSAMSRGQQVPNSRSKNSATNNILFGNTINTILLPSNPGFLQLYKDPSLSQ